MSKIKIWALFGEAGAGKDYILNKIIENIENTNKIVSHTTRPPRDYEKEGVDYWFVNSKQFKNMINNNEFLEYTIFNTWYYGTNINNLQADKINVGVFNPEGIKSLLKYQTKLDVNPIRIMASPETRLIRQIKRGKNNPDYEEILRRFNADKKDFKHIDFFYYTLNNPHDFDPIDYKEYLEYYLGALM